MKWTTLRFGKHTGRTLPQVVWTDPDWFFWAYEVGVFLVEPRMQQEADVIFRRPRRIRVRQRRDERLVVEYGIDLRGRYANIEVVAERRAQRRGSTRTVRLPYFDLSFPRRLAPYDKSGCRALVRAVKFYVFGDPDFRLTKERSEAFFECDANFVLEGGPRPDPSGGGAEQDGSAFRQAIKPQRDPL